MSEEDPADLELARVIEYWQQVGLEARKTEIDNQALGISDQHDRSVRARKNLAEKTKGFVLLFELLNLLPTCESLLI